MTRTESIAYLISKMTLEQKASQLLHDSPAVPTAGIPTYNWWNEGLHGVARAGTATVFPQAIGLAATFDPEFIFTVATAVSDEARAKYNESVSRGVRAKYRGLTYWTPNVNIFRDPRWGRGQETYGEDPYLTSQIGLAFMRGLQGDDPKFLKLAACAKHFAVHSGPEKLRHTFDAVVSKKDLFETYLPAFKALVAAGVESVMGAYNRTLGEPCCASTYLMKDILRGRWKFKGHYVSDCWAIRDFHEHHGVTHTPEESAALALNLGCDLNCGCTYNALVSAVKQGLVKEEKIDESLARLFDTRFKLGMFDPERMTEIPANGILPSAKTPWDGLNSSVVDCAAHRALARKAAAKSVVLLKNRKNILPLDDSEKKILLIGPGAANLHALMGNYYGANSRYVTILEGVTEKIRDKFGITMDYHQGCMMYDENKNTGWTIGMAEAADVVIACFGLDNAMEGEEGDAIASEAKGDRNAIELPEWQYAYLRALSDRGTPVVLVLTGGCPVIVPEDIADAILFVWYPGEEGGSAIADILFGDAVPSGKLPVTFPKSTSQLPPYDAYAMKGRTYRYMTEKPQYPFGFGLSYAKFSFSNPVLTSTTLHAGETVNFSVDVSNAGPMAADEVVQVYIEKIQRLEDDPVCSLRAFTRVTVPSGSTVTAKCTLSSADFETVNANGEFVLVPGDWRIIGSDCAPCASWEEKGAVKPVISKISVKGVQS
jgi:beta-glucosidase